MTMTPIYLQLFYVFNHNNKHSFLLHLSCLMAKFKAEQFLLVSGFMRKWDFRTFIFITTFLQNLLNKVWFWLNKRNFDLIIIISFYIASFYFMVNFGTIIFKDISHFLFTSVDDWLTNASVKKNVSVDIFWGKAFWCEPQG